MKALHVTKLLTIYSNACKVIAKQVQKSLLVYPHDLRINKLAHKQAISHKPIPIAINNDPFQSIWNRMRVF